MKKYRNISPYWNCIREILFVTFENKQLVFPLVFALLFLLVGLIANISIPFILKTIVDSFVFPASIFSMFILISYGTIWTLSQVSNEFRAFLSYRIEQRITQVLGLKVFSHLYSLSHAYFIDQQPGALTNIIRRAQRDVPSLVLGIFFHVIPTTLQFVMTIIIVASIFPPMFSILLGGTLATLLTYILYSLKSVAKQREVANEVDQKVDGLVTDWLSNHEAIKTFGKKEFAVDICESGLKQRESAEIEFLRKSSLSYLGQSVILGIGLTVFTYFTGLGVFKENITIGDFILLNGYMLQFIMPISILGHVIQDIKKALVDMKGIVGVLSIQSDIQEISIPIQLSEQKLQIEFKNVNFSYKNKMILNDLCFKILPGETALITGPTGIGKSTLAKLLLRLYDPTVGQILLNDIDLKSVSFRSLYENIGWVPQETYLLNDTIKNNIHFVRPEASHKEIETALDQANILDFVMDLPKKLDTCVGDKGLKLSGGQKQRLSLARLFLKKPQICILDEATSFLDRSTELTIQDNLNRDLPNMTKIIITHRPFMIDRADQVINLQENVGFSISQNTIAERDFMLNVSSTFYHKKLYPNKLRREQ